MLERIARGIAHAVLTRVDAAYHRAHRLRRIGEILYVGREHYRGPARSFADGTRLAPGDTVGTLHFNNRGFAQLSASNSTRAALGFARLMLQSMQQLAERVLDDPEFRDIEVFHAVSWLPAHGERVGFVTAALPGGLRRRWLAAWFRLLVWTFAPAAHTRSAARPDPHHYWLLRSELLKRFPPAARKSGAGHSRIAHAGT